MDEKLGVRVEWDGKVSNLFPSVGRDRGSAAG